MIFFSHKFYFLLHENIEVIHVAFLLKNISLIDNMHIDFEYGHLFHNDYLIDILVDSKEDIQDNVHVM